MVAFDEAERPSTVSIQVACIVGNLHRFVAGRENMHFGQVN